MNITTTVRDTDADDINRIAASIFSAYQPGHYALDGASVTISESNSITVETIAHAAFCVTHVWIGEDCVARMIDGDRLSFVAWTLLLDANASDDPPSHWLDLVEFPAAYLALRPNVLAGVPVND